MNKLVKKLMILTALTAMGASSIYASEITSESVVQAEDEVVTPLLDTSTAGDISFFSSGAYMYETIDRVDLSIAIGETIEYNGISITLYDLIRSGHDVAGSILVNYILDDDLDEDYENSYKYFRNFSLHILANDEQQTELMQQFIYDEDTEDSTQLAVLVAGHTSSTSWSKGTQLGIAFEYSGKTDIEDNNKVFIALDEFGHYKQYNYATTANFEQLLEQSAQWEVITDLSQFADPTVNSLDYAIDEIDTFKIYRVQIIEDPQTDSHSLNVIYGWDTNVLVENPRFYTSFKDIDTQTEIYAGYHQSTVLEDGTTIVSAYFYTNDFDYVEYYNFEMMDEETIADMKLRLIIDEDNLDNYQFMIERAEYELLLEDNFALTVDLPEDISTSYTLTPNLELVDIYTGIEFVVDEITLSTLGATLEISYESVDEEDEKYYFTKPSVNTFEVIYQDDTIQELNQRSGVYGNTSGTTQFRIDNMSMYVYHNEMLEIEEPNLFEISTIDTQNIKGIIIDGLTILLEE
ncbi:MAG: hypothetical protein ATN34_05170 [Epulopiscium sp. Nele67-Bin002]|nr:MAG: hypothetical protein ATN34_05170 [Epulopiscium sp. Nele67-Bin002]